MRKGIFSAQIAVCAISLVTFQSLKGSLNVDLIVFSRNRAMQLYGFLESAATKITGWDHVYVLYRADSERHSLAYGHVWAAFPALNINPIRQGKCSPDDFKPLLIGILEKSSSDYVIFAVDDILVKEPVDLHVCVQYLEKTSQAHGFFLRFGRHIMQSYTQNRPLIMPELTEIFPGVLTWQFGGKLGPFGWGYSNTVDMTIYRKNYIVETFKKLQFNSPNTLEGTWASLGYNRPLGLCFETAKILNVPANRVQTDCENRTENSYSAEALLTLFERGFKIDINCVYSARHDSPHVPLNYAFVKR